MCKSLGANSEHARDDAAHAARFIFDSLTDNNEILPVQAQIVGMMLENAAKLIGDINERYYLSDLGGKDGLIERYFSAYVESSPNRDVSLQVLFALSIEIKLRGQLSIDQLSSIVHRDKVDVNRCLQFFVREGLIRDTKDGLYELAHDYLAEKFHEISGTELDPMERDNIMFFWDEMRRSPHGGEYRSSTDVMKGFVFSDLVIGYLAVLLILRLTGTLYGVDWGWFNLLKGFKLSGMGIDIYFLPVFASHLAWSIYVALFYRRLFSRLRESRLARALSIFTVINCAGWVTLAVFKPYYWLWSIGMGGLAIGAKFSQLAKSSAPSNISEQYFGKIALRTIVNLLITSTLGIGMVYCVHFYGSTEAVARILNAISFFLSIIMTYYMLAIRADHITRNAASKMLGLIDQPLCFAQHYVRVAQR